MVVGLDPALSDLWGSGTSVASGAAATQTSDNKYLSLGLEEPRRADDRHPRQGWVHNSWKQNFNEFPQCLTNSG